MGKHKLAIIGRPNVGKSHLFNRICKKRLSIVDEAEGVTRDRLYGVTDLFGFPFEVIDTGGIHRNSGLAFNNEVLQQAHLAIEEADTILFVVDGMVGITDLDQQVANLLQKTKKPVTVAVNKIDRVELEELKYPFLALGFSKVVAVSAAHNWQIAELLEEAFENFTKTPSEEENQSVPHIAIVGRPNVGKSSLINTFLSDNRCIVSPIPGTTRDSIDTPLTYDGLPYTLIDTAGIRRKKSEHEVVDKFAFIRTKEAIERSNICLLMLNAQEGISTQDFKILNLVEKAGKPTVLLFNKWDLVKGFRMEHCLKDLQISHPFISHCPKLFISVKQQRNLEKIFPLIREVIDESSKRIPTPELNQFFEKCLQRTPPPMIQGKRLKIFYATQAKTNPPCFLLFVNNKSLVTETYKRYLINQFRKSFGFSGSPIVLSVKGKRKR